MRRIFYITLRTYVAIGFRMFYSKWQVHYLDDRFRKKPTIFASNHQNAFMDPLDIVFSQPRITVFLTRAQAFRSKIARFFFHLLYMLPIYRASIDGLSSVRNNDAILKQSSDYLLNNTHPIGIYVEGNHGMKRHLRRLQKGICRLAFDTLDRNPDLELYIVPAGMNYSNHMAFRGDLLVLFGNPIKVSEYYQQYLEDPARATNDLLKEIELRLKEVIVDIPEENYDEIYAKWIAVRYSTDNLLEDFYRDKLIIKALTEELPVDDLVKNRPVEDKGSELMMKRAMFPLYIYARINNFIGFYISRLILKKIHPEDAFVSSIKLVLGTFLVPVVYLMQTLVVYSLTHKPETAVAYLLSLPIASLLYFKTYVKPPFK